MNCTGETHIVRGITNTLHSEKFKVEVDWFIVNLTTNILLNVWCPEATARTVSVLTIRWEHCSVSICLLFMCSIMQKPERLNNLVCCLFFNYSQTYLWFLNLDSFFHLLAETDTNTNLVRSHVHTGSTSAVIMGHHSNVTWQTLIQYYSHLYNLKLQGSCHQNHSSDLLLSNAWIICSTVKNLQATVSKHKRFLNKPVMAPLSFLLLLLL